MKQALVKLQKTEIRSFAGSTLPALFSPDPGTAKRVFEFFAANIRNPNTRKAYAKATGEFAAWCEARGLAHLRDVQPVHVAAYIEALQHRIAAPSVKLQLAAIRMLFDWLVLGQIVPTNPASVVRGPKHSIKKGKTPVLSADEARTLLDSIHIDHGSPDRPRIVGLRDRAIIALLTYTFARVGAAVQMRVEDVYAQARRTWTRLHEKGRKRHEMPCHHSLEAYLEAYIAAADLADDPKGYLFRTTEGQSGTLTDRPMSRTDVYRMINRRADDAGIKTKIGCHTFRATGITEYLRNGGKLEIAQQMANHESARTTGLYDRRDDEYSPNMFHLTLNASSVNPNDPTRTVRTPIEPEDLTSERQIRNYMLRNHTYLLTDLSSGRGEYLTSLYKLLHLPNSPETFRQLKALSAQYTTAPAFSEAVLGQFYTAFPTVPYQQEVAGTTSSLSTP